MNAKINKRSHACKCYSSSYVEILNSFDLKLQLKSTVSAYKLIHLLTELKDFKFVTTLGLQFKKVANYNKTREDNFYLNTKQETIIDKKEIDDVFESV